MSGWYYAVGEKQFGPIDDRTLKELASSGGLTLDSLVCHAEKTKNQWVAAKQLSGLKTLIDRATIQIRVEQPAVVADKLRPALARGEKPPTVYSPLKIVGIGCGGLFMICFGLGALGAIGESLGIIPKYTKSTPVTATPETTSAPVPKQSPQHTTSNEQIRQYRRSEFISAAALYGAYHANEVKADKELTGRELAVYGKLESIENDFLGNPTVTFETSQLIGVQCNFNKDWSEQISEMQIGHTLFVVGQCTGKTLITVMLSDCKLVQPID